MLCLDGEELNAQFGGKKKVETKAELVEMDFFTVARQLFEIRAHCDKPESVNVN